MTTGSRPPISGSSAIASPFGSENDMEFRKLVDLSLLDRSFQLDARCTFTDPALILQLRNDAGEIAAVDIDGHVDAVVLDQISRLLSHRALAHNLEIELLFNDFVVLLDNEVGLSRADDRVLILSSRRERDC